MKYLLLPFTIILWHLLIYYCLYAVYAGLITVSYLHWIWIIIGFTIIITIISLFSVTIPTVCSILINNLYGDNFLIKLLHFFSGILALVFFFIFLFSDESIYTIKKSYFDNKWKLIILGFPYIGIILSSLFSNFVIFNMKKND